MMKRINTWSSPRNISTAFMYAFAQHKDFSVVDEPLYAHYLTQTDTEAIHPGTDEILATMENDGQKVVEWMLQHDFSSPYVLFKQMTHHLIAIDEAFLLEMDNVLLIRDPRRIIASYSKVVDNAQMHDVGVKMQFDLYKKLEKIGRAPIVIDARRLLLNPANILQQLCEALDIPFDKNMLTWEAGARPEDGCWAKYWYTNVHRSTGFQKYQEKKVVLNPNMETLALACQPYYDFLLEKALK